MSISAVIKPFRAVYAILKDKRDRERWRSEVRKIGDFHNALTPQQRKEAEEYWSRYTKHFSPLWHELFTAKTGVFDVRYMPEDFHFVELEPLLNVRASDYGIDDKNNYAMYFPEVRHPRSVFRKMNGIYHDDDYTIISKEKAVQNCIDCGNIILKPPKLYGIGAGIRFWKTEDGVDKLLKIIDDMGDSINAQEYIQTHPDMARMNPSSCNTIRVVTYANADGVRVIRSYYQVGMSDDARMGQVSTGGVCVSILSDGTLAPTAYDVNYNAHTVHSCGIKFEGYRIPSYDKVCATAIRLANKLGDFRLISWDFTVAPDGEPVFIEMNLHEGGVMYHQLSNGPMYGELTEEILNTVLEKR